MINYQRKRNLYTRSDSGFTLMEILIVIVIIGILAAIGLGSFKSTQQKSRDAQRKSDLKNISTALELYYNDKREYPPESGGKVDACSGECNPGDLMAEGSTTYMVQFPGDPSAYEYQYESDGTYYRLYARLENVRDRQSVQVGGEPAEYGTTDCGSVACNYGIASSNNTLPNPSLP